MFSFKKLPICAGLVAPLCFGVSAAHGVEAGGIEFTGSGFMSVVAGKMLGGTRGGEASDYARPIFVSDYAQGGIYDGRGGLQWSPDSKLGLQGTATLPDKRLSFTGQVVSRGARDGQVNLEWLYASYKLDENFTLQAGRKRIPMFYYSDTQDIGLALPWTHLPSQLYGWEAVNYNGVNLTYRGQWGGWSSSVNVLAGGESMKDTGYDKVYFGRKSRTDVKWDNILGGDITLANDWLETRFVYIQSHTRRKVVDPYWDPATDTYDPTTVTADYSSPGRQQIYGVAVNIDYNNFLVRSEAIFIDHDRTTGYRDYAQILGVGYRLGKWTPMVTVSNYRYRPMVTATTDTNNYEAHRTTAFTLRYDLSPSSAIKAQYDYQRDLSGSTFTLDGSGVATNRFGNARLLTVAYDMVF